MALWVCKSGVLKSHTVFYNENDDKINYAAVEMAINNALNPAVSNTT